MDFIDELVGQQRRNVLYELQRQQLGSGLGGLLGGTGYQQAQQSVPYWPFQKAHNTESSEHTKPSFYERLKSEIDAWLEIVI